MLRKIGVRMPGVYEGDRPYIFVNYAHADKRVALAIIDALVREGYRVWWDDGIQLATAFPEYIANRIRGCGCFVMLVSRSSLASDWCMREVYYALDLRKTILPIYLEDVELTPGLKMSIGFVQSIYWHAYASDAEFNERLFATDVLYPSLGERGKAHRGVKPRTQEPADVRPLGVAKRGKLADYSWKELKELSRMIAAARSDAEGLGIARAYRLVDKDGRLQGDTKEVVLGDKGKTKAHVRVLGFRHDELAGGGRAGISFEFANVPARCRVNPTDTNAGGWEESEMRRWLNSTFLGLLPDDLRANVAEARNRTNNRGMVTENDIACVTTTEDRLWLLSMTEVYGRLSSQKGNVPWSPATYEAEGVQYRLYVDKGVSTTSYDSCRKHGAYSRWWLRSPYAHDSVGFRLVDVVGGWGWGDANYAWGVSPGFCF